jgi:citrate synthase
VLLSSNAAAKALGVKPSTLYAYVSRGLIQPAERHGGKGSWFHPDAIAAFAAERGSRTRDERLVVVSAITHVGADGHSYRGIPAVTLTTTPFESVAEHLWSIRGPELDAPADARKDPPARPVNNWRPDERWVDLGRQAVTLAAPYAPMHDRLRLVGAVIGANDPLGHNAEAAAVAATARRLIPSLVLALSGTDPEANLEADLWRAIGDAEAPATDRAVLRRALALLADHGLAASTLAARTAAAYGAGPHAMLGAALGAFSGDRHGAAPLGVEHVVRAALADGAGVAVGEALAQRGSMPGLGHPLYPEGDPRAINLLDALRSARSTERTMYLVDEIIAITSSRGLDAPNVDFALGAMTVALDLRPGSGELVFAIARTAGWIAHGIEAGAHPPVRPRVRYVGPDEGEP